MVKKEYKVKKTAHSPVTRWSGKKNPLVSVVEFNTHHRAPLLVQKGKKKFYV
jgi:hypothetical protein